MIKHHFPALLGLMLWCSVTSIQAHGSALATLDTCLAGHQDLSHSPTGTAAHMQDRLFQLGTTGSTIFTHNLDSQIRYLGKQLRRNANDLPARIQLAHQLWQKGLIYSDMGLIAQARQQADEVVRMAANQGKSHLLRARINMSMHRFDQAMADLSKLPPTHPEAMALHHQIQSLRGDASVTTDTPWATTANWASWGSALLAQGRPEAAGIVLEKAVAGITDTHPIPVVALHLLKSQWAQHSGQPALAVAHLHRAVTRLPRHVGALEALAAVYQANDQTRHAIACLNVARHHSPDPHLTGLLATAYAAQGETAKAARLAQAAINAFKQALLLYPQAYAGEAAGYFFQQAGDPQHSPPDSQALLQAAAHWAKFDAQNRPQPERWLLVADISIALQQTSVAVSALGKVTAHSQSQPRQREQARSLLAKLKGNSNDKRFATGQ